MVCICVAVSVQQGAGNQTGKTQFCVSHYLYVSLTEKTNKTAHTNWVLQQPQSRNALLLPRGQNVWLCLCSYRGITASVCAFTCVCLYHM